MVSDEAENIIFDEVHYTAEDRPVFRGEQFVLIWSGTPLEYTKKHIDPKAENELQRAVKSIDAPLKTLEVEFFPETGVPYRRVFVVAPEMPPVMVHQADINYSAKTSVIEGMDMLQLVELHFGPEAIEEISEEDAMALILAFKYSLKKLVHTDWS